MGQMFGRWMVVPCYPTVLPVGEATTGYVDDFSLRGASVDMLKALRAGTGGTAPKPEGW